MVRCRILDQLVLGSIPTCARIICAAFGKLLYPDVHTVDSAVKMSTDISLGNNNSDWRGIAQICAAIQWGLDAADMYRINCTADIRLSTGVRKSRGLH